MKKFLLFTAMFAFGTELLAAAAADDDTRTALALAAAKRKRKHEVVVPEPIPETKPEPVKPAAVEVKPIETKMEYREIGGQIYRVPVGSEWKVPDSPPCKEFLNSSPSCSSCQSGSCQLRQSCSSCTQQQTFQPFQFAPSCQSGACQSCPSFQSFQFAPSQQSCPSCSGGKCQIR